MIRYMPSRVIILDRESVRNSKVTVNVLSRIANTGCGVVYLTEEGIDAEIAAALKKSDPFREGKKTLLITENKGEFLKKCPGTNEYICCNYYVIDFAQNCPMDCTYCILQAYLNNPFMVLYSNIDDLFRELDSRLDSAGTEKIRIGTGEFTDSLALEHLTEYSNILMDYFAGRPDVFIEFKTKTDYVETFLKRPAIPNALLSWSVNAQNVTAREEHRTATIVERLSAARECARAGYSITLHFDPIIDYEKFNEEMEKTVSLIFEYLSASSIKYISLGCFRFLPRLRDVIAERFPNSRIIYNEFVRGYDGKIRYFRFKRERLFGGIIELIRKYDPDKKIELYFCMESEEMWKKLLPSPPSDDESLGCRLYDKCRRGLEKG